MALDDFVTLYARFAAQLDDALNALEAEGAHERAQFWFVMLVLLGDINSGRINPDAHLSIH